MADPSSYTVVPLSSETWPAFEALVERHGGIFGGCWCIWFHPDGPERGQGAETNRALGVENGYDYAFVPGTGHMLQIEKPTECARLVEEFLARCGLRP